VLVAASGESDGVASGLAEQPASAIRATGTIRQLRRIAAPFSILIQTAPDLGLTNPCAKPMHTYIRHV
jgi:hypothetical protein